MSKIYFYLGLFLFIASCSQESDLQLNLQQSETFLLNNLTNDQVILIEEGLQYSIIQSGDTNTIPPALSETITAHFHGTLMDGTVFWSSVEMGDPLIIQLSQLIQGCQKAISQMREGDIWRVFIHPDLAYGEEGRPTIPPNSTLIFEIELINIDR
ncbi:FKBP-type peptidyl-prolyl cis-trans isomerase [Gammaproteobacteria bacterium]|nr:FKBP-type peptidyl-prolyl cis-trans isomerase [Gammaproteobacteria bacterium]MDA9365013.1 FKBP-type peptidyl-prolyl cis-trans isomerase [Gammaproteobacteria bacterium]MDA9973608.1 FKBP-type peptidyl-prolyl cis-trans isomerase [Gammaproteobacteria bacterium]MDB4210294.1 FKBP-type peptidyl-prolyl cis-trans isomerase [Gammaproteobacteria bacterium]MDB9790602.1 FKBP-type peptidyl-prolyl cis-trans isomerase [Gammaproteobacteria bacterium]